MFKPVIFYKEGQTTYENLGDLLIARTLLANLREYGRIVVDDLGVPVWYRKEIGPRTTSAAAIQPFLSLLSYFPQNASLSQRSTVYLVLPSTHSHSRSLQRDVQLMLAPPLMMLLRLL